MRLLRYRMSQAERWFQKLSKNWMGKRFTEKADCKKFFKHMEEQHPAFAAENENKLNIMSVCASQKQASARACRPLRRGQSSFSLPGGLVRGTEQKFSAPAAACTFLTPRCTSTLLA